MLVFLPLFIDKMAKIWYSMAVAMIALAQAREESPNIPSV